MDTVLERIDAWQAAGLIDGPTADRLRSAEVARIAGEPGAATLPTAVAAELGRSQRSAGSTFSGAGSWFGPSITIGEMFAYLGGAFFIGAWTTFLARIADTKDRDAILTGGSTLAVIVLLGLATRLRTGDIRRRRAAGVMFLVATGGAVPAAGFAIQLIGDQIGNQFDGPIAGIFVAAIALAVAVAGRRRLPALTTQLALLGAVTGVGAATLSVLEAVITGTWGLRSGGACDPCPSPEATPVILVFLGAVGWLVVALVIGLIGLAEARAGTEPAKRRAAVTRLGAGLVAVIGLATSISRQGSLGGDQYGRLLQPWIGDIALLILAAILVERAFRRDTNAFLVAAAIGLVVALTDFNFSYLSQSTDVGLLIEGAMLLVVGVVGDRLRRRLDRSVSPAGPTGGGEAPGAASTV